MDCFEGLNAAQAEVVGSPEGPMLVIAGPGTGKTLTMVRRIAYLLTTGLPPETIAAVTFTNRAAREMRERLIALLGPGARQPFVGTFHVMGLQILARFYGGEISVITRGHQIELLQALSGGAQRRAKERAAAISKARSMLLPPANDVLPIYEAYRAELRAHNWFDFDDLIDEPLHLLRTNPAIHSAIVPYRRFLVDEYQDVSPSQYALLRELMGGSAAVCAVGDADQAIYGFRGADISEFLDFRHDFPGSRAVTLTESYRSTGKILNCAAALIKHNSRRIAKDLSPVRQVGLPVRIVSVPDEFAEAAFVAREIEARMGAMDHLRLSRTRRHSEASNFSYRFSDFAVLFRTNAQARPFRRSLEEAGIPCQTATGPESGWTGMIDLLTQACREGSSNVSPQDLVLEAWKASGSPGEWAYLEALCRSYSHRSRPEALQGMIGELRLLEPLDCFDRNAEKVHLMTFHMAKGLEFGVVFLAGAEDGLTPLLRDDSADSNVEEERRLFYVAMTRARDELFLVSRRSRALFGERVGAVPSRFIAELPEQLVETVQVDGRRRKEKQKTQATLF